MSSSKCGPGVNYIEVTQNFTGPQEEKAKAAAEGIKAVIREKKKFILKAIPAAPFLIKSGSK